jgi:hypothetical protein
MFTKFIAHLVIFSEAIMMTPNFHTMSQEETSENMKCTIILEMSPYLCVNTKDGKSKVWPVSTL